MGAVNTPVCFCVVYLDIDIDMRFTHGPAYKSEQCTSLIEMVYAR